MISYSQNCEDVLLARLFADQPTGFYVDVGANDPVNLSITKHFSDHGWRGINIEPGTAPFGRLSAERPRDINLPIGIASEPGELTLYECPQNDALSTFSPDQANEYRKAGWEVHGRRVAVCTLDQVFRDYVTETIDFLTIDVEGFEREVLLGARLRTWRPRVIVIEATRPSTQIPSHADWESELLNAQYLFAHFDGLNRFYLRQEDHELMKEFVTPPNITDRYQTYETVCLAAQVNQKDGAITQLHEDARQLQQQLTEKDTALFEAIGQLQVKDDALVRVHEAAQQLQQQLLQKDAALHSALGQLRDREESLQQLHEAGAALRQQLEDKEAALQDKCAAVDDLHEQLWSKEQSLLEALKECQLLQPASRADG